MNKETDPRDMQDGIPEWVYEVDQARETREQKKMVSQQEFFARQVQETPRQLEFFDRISDIVGDPRFASTSAANIIMRTGVWNSVEKGDLTHMQGAVLQRQNRQAIFDRIQMKNEPNF